MANPVQINDGLHVDAVAGVGVTSAQEARSSLSSMVVHDANGPRTGVFYEGTQQLIGATSVTSPSMQVSVVPLGFCGQKALAEGVYINRNSGIVYVDVAAAPASNSRIDTVYAMQRDKNSTTSPDGITQGEVGIVTGTAAVSPTAPAAPAGAVVVGTVTVAAGVTATSNAGCTIATTCQWTTTAGSPVPVRNQAERDATISAYDGLQAYRLDQHAIDQYANGSWGWQTYTPVITGATTNPTLGTGGTITGRYKQDGKTVTASGTIHFGTGATFGSGVYSISLPVPSQNGTTSLAGQVVVLPASGGFWGMGWATSSGTAFQIYISGSNTGSGTAALTGTSTPIGAAWGAGAEIRFNLSYEAA